MFSIAPRRIANAQIARSLPVTSLLSSTSRRSSTLSSNKNIYVFPNPLNSQSHVLTLLPTNPPTSQLIIGEAPTLPPESSPSSFRENQKFLQVLHSVIAEHGHEDPQIRGQAAALASSSGASIMQVNRRTATGSAGASDQGGAGGGGQGGYIHVSDNRHPPDFGRIAEPEDIFGSLEVEGDGSFTDGTGKYQQSGTYRIVTRDGVLGLPDHLMKRLIERMKNEEAAVKSSN